VTHPGRAELITVVIEPSYFAEQRARLPKRAMLLAMPDSGPCTRGFLTLALARALRPGAEDHSTPGLDGLDPSAWVRQRQHLHVAAAVFDHTCGGDWSHFHEICAASVEAILELGYRAVVHFGDPAQTFAALSVLWRASFNYGRAIADTDATGATIHVIDRESLNELEGNVHAGWCLGVARLIGADCEAIELRRRPWAQEGPEQVVRLLWRDPTPTRRPLAGRMHTPERVAPSEWL
jgi:hypothetical protein